MSGNPWSGSLLRPPVHLPADACEDRATLTLSQAKLTIPGLGQRDRLFNQPPNQEPESQERDTENGGPHE